MPRRRSATLQFNAIQLVGGLLPVSLLEQIALQQAPRQRAANYGLARNQRLQPLVDQAWNRAKALWQQAQELRQRGVRSGDATPWARWYSERRLREVFGRDDLAPCPPRQLEAALDPISHQAFAGAAPVLRTGLANEELDKGLSRLRDLAIRSGAHEPQHSDLWKVQRLVFAELGQADALHTTQAFFDGAWSRLPSQEVV